MAKWINSERMVCPLLRPTKEDFSRPFVEYVEQVFKDHPDSPCFRVAPPGGYTPRKESGYPAPQTVQLNTPIRQQVGHVFCFLLSYRKTIQCLANGVSLVFRIQVTGSDGVFKCYYVEQKVSSGTVFELC
jgi:hypothetical protein